MTRLRRLAHNHVFQSSPDTVDGCPACAAISPQHMTRDYVRGVQQQALMALWSQ